MYFVKREFGFPDPLNQALLDYFWTGSVPSARELKSFGETLRKLWEDLAKNRGQARADSHYSFNSKATDAYGAYYLPANAMKTALILEEAMRLGVPVGNPAGKTRWMDLGCGP